MKVAFRLVLALVVASLISAAQVRPADLRNSAPTPVQALAHNIMEASDNRPDPANATEEIPSFHSEARMVLVTVGVWKHVPDKHPDQALVPPQVVEGVPPILLAPHLRYARKLDPHLTKSDFRIFDNGTEQTVTYFKKTVLPLKDETREVESSWTFYSTFRGIWGMPPAYLFPLNVYASGDVPSEITTAKRRDFSLPDITYVVGYVPPAIEAGKCHDLRVEVANHDVGLARDKYCNLPTSQPSGQSLLSTDDAAAQEDTEIERQMRSLVDAKVNGSIKVSAHAAVFWSSRISYFPAAQNTVDGSNTQPNSDVLFPVEARAFNTSARVHITVEFVPPRKDWVVDCHKNPALHIYGITYKADHQLASRFLANFKCSASELVKKRIAIETDGSGYRVKFPSRFDTQMDLGPGDYELRVVVSDGGKEFGMSRLPVHVEKLDAQQPAISDIVLSSFPRDASKVLDDTVAVSPAQLVPAPLISRNIEFLPDTETRISQHIRLPIYFEIYEPVPPQTKADVYMHFWITNLTNSSVVLDSGRISAANWVLPGTSAVPVGFSLGTQKLEKGNYRVDVEASDAAGRQSASRYANFSVN